MRVLAAAVLIALPQPAGAKPTAAGAKSFLTKLYAPYARSEPTGMGEALQFPGRYFEPRLASAMIKDTKEAAARDEVGALDGDPICNCQDNEPFRATVGPVTVRNGHALAVVTFRNFKPISLRYDLISTANGWRIYDIHAAGHSLRALFKL